MKKLLFFIFLFSTTFFYSQDFINGVHLINMDNKAYTIRYTECELTTRICRITKPVPAIKNGLACAILRNKIKGFKIISKKKCATFGEIEITAIISPKTTVNCLSVSLKSFELIGFGKLSSVSNRKIVISGGRITSILKR